MASPDALGVGPKPISSSVTASASSVFSASWLASYAFNGIIGGSGNSWSAASSTPAWLQAELSPGAIVTGYKIYARTDSPQTSPSAWTLEGSNDESTWTTLDTQSGQSWFAGQGRQYVFSNSMAYTFYRLNFTATQSVGALVALSELILYEGTGSTLLDWWKADDIVGVPDGTSLNATSIVDASGNSHTFTTNVRAGVYRASTGPGGMPFIDGSTTSGFVYSGPAKPAPTDDLTYFAVLKTGSSAVQSIIGSVNSGGAQLRLNNYKLELDQDGITTVATSTKSVSPNTWTIVIISYNQLTGQYKVNIHGTKESVSGPTNRVFTSPGSTLSFGGFRGTTTTPWLGGIAEVGRFTSVLSDTDQAELYDYLVAKYFPNPSQVQVESNYVETMVTGTTNAQVETHYVEAMATGITNSQIAAQYLEAMMLVQPAMVESVYVESLLTSTPPVQVESIYIESLIQDIPRVQASSTYVEVMLLPLPSVGFKGWGSPI